MLTSICCVLEVVVAFHFRNILRYGQVTLSCNVWKESFRAAVETVIFSSLEIELSHNRLKIS